MYDILAGILIGIVISLALVLLALYFGRRLGIFSIIITPRDPVPKVDRLAIMNLQSDLDELRSRLADCALSDNLYTVDARLTGLEATLEPYLGRARTKSFSAVPDPAEIHTLREKDKE